MEKRPDKNASYENATRPQIVKVTGFSQTELSYQVIEPTSDNPKSTFICSIDRFNNLYTKI